MENPNGQVVVTAYESGSASVKELQTIVRGAWRDALASSQERDEIAGLLSVAPDDLDPEKPPFSVDGRGGGLTGMEIFIVLAGAYALGVAKELAEEAGKQSAKAAVQQFRRVWANHMRRRVDPPQSDNKLGNETPPL